MKLTQLPDTNANDRYIPTSIYVVCKYICTQ